MSENEAFEVYELTIEPEEPDTVASTRREIQSMIEAALKESGHEDLLKGKQISIKMEKPFPEAIVVSLLLGFASKVVADIFMKEVYPIIRERFKAVIEKRKKD